MTPDEDASAYRLAAERITRLEREKAELLDLVADCYWQMAIHYCDGWMGDGALSTARECQDALLAAGRLEKHPTKPLCRWKT